jgi:hypothetical protein
VYADPEALYTGKTARVRGMGLEIVSGESPDPYWEIVSWENALPVEVNLFRHTYNTLRPHQALDEGTPRAAYLAVEHSIRVWPLADPLLDWEVLT